MIQLSVIQPVCGTGNSSAPPCMSFLDHAAMLFIVCIVAQASCMPHMHNTKHIHSTHMHNSLLSNINFSLDDKVCCKSSVNALISYGQLSVLSYKVHIPPRFLAITYLMLSFFGYPLAQPYTSQSIEFCDLQSYPATSTVQFACMVNY